MIGVPINEGRNEDAFKRIPSFYVNLTRVKLDVSRVDIKNIVSRRVLPIFLPDVQKKINDAKVATRKRLAFACNNLGKHVQEIWYYLKLIMLYEVNVPEYEEFNFNTLHDEFDYMQFKVVCRFWISEVETVIESIRSVFQFAVRRFTQIGLAVMATQSSGYAEKIGFYIATANDVLLNTEPGSKTCRECANHFVEWFSERLNTLQFNVPDIMKTEIVTKLGIPIVHVELYSIHKEWLQNVLKDMYESSLHSFYSQIHLSSLDFGERTWEWAQDMMADIDVFPTETTAHLSSDAPSISFASTFANMLQETRNYSKLNAKTDIYIISTSLYELFSTGDLTDETFEAIDETMNRVTGYDFVSFLYVLHFSTSRVRLETEEINTIQSLIGKGLLEILQQISTQRRSREQKRLDLKQYERQYRPFSLDSRGFETLVKLYIDNVTELDSERVKTEAQKIMQSNDFGGFQNAAPADVEIFLSDVFEYAKSQRDIDNLTKEKDDLQGHHKARSKEGYHSLLKTVEEKEAMAQNVYIEFLKAVERNSDLSWDDLTNNVQNQNALKALRMWLESEGKQLYTAGGAHRRIFDRQLASYFPFNVISSDEAVVTELVTQIMQCLDYHEMAKVLSEQAEQTKTALQEKRHSLSRWYFIGIIIAFLLFGFLLWYGVPYLFAKPEVAATATAAMQGKIARIMANVRDVFAAYIPDAPLVDAVKQIGRSTASAFLLRWPGWDDVNPWHIYTAAHLGVVGLGEYAMVFWTGGFLLGRALLKWTRTLGDWCALGHIRSIDNSPELAWDAEIEIVIDQENRQRSIFIKHFMGSMQSWLQSGQAIRAAIGHLAWNAMHPVLPQIVGRNRERAPAVLRNSPQVLLLEGGRGQSFVPRLQLLSPKNDQIVADQVMKQNRNMKALPAPGSTTTSTFRVDEPDSDFEL